MGITVLRLGLQYRIPTADVLRVLGLSQVGMADQTARDSP
jgi:hypothetical protein